MATSATSPRSVAGTPRSNSRRLRRQCTADDCNKVDAGGGFCVAHGGGKKCAFPGCRKGYQTGGYCRAHGGGARCQVEGCGKVDAGRGLCRAHGGGKRCQQDGCSKADVGGGFCTAHGGGKRCSEPGCTKIDQGGGKCRAHGGARRCREEGCDHPARGATGLCSDHGGAQLCATPNCRRIAKEEGGKYCSGCARVRMKKEEGVERDVDQTMPPFSVMLARNSPVYSPPYEYTSVASGSMDPFNAFVTAATTVEISPQFNESFQGPSSPIFINESVAMEGEQREEEVAEHASNQGSCLDNGCSKSFGGRCNCKVGCTCCSRARAAESERRAAAQDIEREGDGDDASTSSTSATPTPSVTYLPLPQLIVKINNCPLPVEIVKSVFASLSGVRSVSALPQVDERDNEDSPSLERRCQTVVLRCDPVFDAASLESLAHANIEYRVQETSTIDWSYKEVVVKVPDMMCPGNCGRTVMNALLQISSIHTANLMFDERCVIVRGDMGGGDICSAIEAVGFEPDIVAELPLPKRFKFRVNDFASVYFLGNQLRKLLQDVGGVENVLLLENRAEVLVEGILEDAGPLLQAANANRIMMVEIAEEAIGPLVSPFDPTTVGRPCHETNGSKQRTSQSEGDKHVCDVNVCPQNGCEQYMMTVAHTAALAVGWSVPGCAMGWGGECTCGENCKCKGCPQHNPGT